MVELTHISLFTGIGGIDLAAEWAGFTTVLMVENNAYCQKVLKKHWPQVPIIGDIKDVNKETIEEALANAFGRGEQQSERDIAEGRGWVSNGGEETMENTTSQRSRGESGDSLHEGRAASQGGRESISASTRRQASSPVPDNQPADTDDQSKATGTIPPITLITGGFPCQPVSNAGKRKGKDDDRWLWPEMLRVISEIRPTWCVAENVFGLLNMGFNDCISDLESQGYETTSFLIPACAVNAPHRRDRIFIVGYSKRDGYENGHTKARGEDTRSEQGGLCESEETGIVADTKDTNRGRSDGETNTRGRYPEVRGQGIAIRGEEYWAVEPELGRVAHGIPNRVDRLRCLGNAVVPQQIYPILKAIAAIEKGQA
ncbi:hypothetical protein LCGC14_0476830 [marine sediment metagenome]|uniref:DNA (cytosine-5-)-methyltransferase n=1 Tax=marine sediment metagenome TaxID=412755 RepID=A0A0F9UXF5_9ZZZZ